MKLSKNQIEAHKKALDLVHSDKALNIDERFFVVENYREDATHINSAAGAFFTPVELAQSMQTEICEGAHIVDLCAGIGTLSLLTLINNSPKSLTCVELNLDYVNVGKRILPEANWICADALSYEFDRQFDMAISNPPFGKIKTSDWKGKYTGSEFEYKVYDKASQIADFSAFIIPAKSAGFIQSGRSGRVETTNTLLERFQKDTGIIFQASCVDTSFCEDDWHGVKPKVEIVLAKFRKAEQETFFLQSA